MVIYTGHRNRRRVEMDGIDRIEGCTLSDEELKELGIEIPEDETEGKFFKWFDDMLDEIFAECKPKND